MANTSTAATNFDKMVVTLVNKRLEEELRAPLPHLLPGNFVPAKFVEGTNNTMRFLRIADFSVVTGTPSAGTPPWLTEGTTPTAEGPMSIGYEEFSANQAGRFWDITDQALLQSPVDLMAEAANRVARNAVATADQRVADVLLAGTNVMYANGVGASANVKPTDILTGTMVKEAVARLKESNVPTFPDGTYRAIVRPSSTYMLETDTAVGGWIDAQRYAGATALFTGEVGRYAGVRFIESSVAGQRTGSSTIGAGASTINVTGANATDIITAASAHGLSMYQKVIFPSLTGGTGLTSGTTVYYVSAVLSTTTFKVASSRANALAGTSVDFTTDVSAGTMKALTDVNSTFLFGPQAYAFGDWGAIQTFVTAPGGHGDELHQRASIGWKGYFGARLLEATGSRYLRIETANNLY